MIVRKAEIKDIEEIIPVFQEYESASLGYLPKKYQCIRNKKEPIIENIKKAFIKDIRYKDSIFLIALDDKKIVGYIYGIVRDDQHPLFKPVKTGELNDIAVLKEYRSKGIASLMWKELDKWFKRQDCKMITLSVNCNNDHAQEVYKKWGFETFYLRMIKSIE